jgi:hypothetical protein
VLSLGFLAQAGRDELGCDLGPAGDPQRPLLVIDTDVAATGLEVDRAVARLRTAGAITVAVTRGSVPLASVARAADIAIAQGGTQSGAGEVVWVEDPLAAAGELRTGVEASPVASVTLSWLLRGSAQLSVPDALVQESAAFSSLLAGGEFRAWLAARGAPRPADGPERVEVSRAGDVLSIVLSRVKRRNAVDARMRDALREALTVAELDPDVTVEITGAGPSFSAGGDLDEFGTATDPALAHLVRVEASAGAVLHRVRDRVRVRVHGVCMGAGIEIPAFAGRLAAGPGSVFALPEIAMGLIPGAGGTVSITRRIGRQRMLWMALTGTRVDVSTALAWGLIDAID